MIAQLVACAPRNDATQLEYLFAISSATCAGRNKVVNVMLGTVNIVSDLYILLLPLPAIWSLQLPTKKKLGVSAIFTTGIGYVSSMKHDHEFMLTASSACVSSTLALVFRVRLNQADDNIWIVVPLWIVTWVKVEVQPSRSLTIIRTIEITAGVIIPFMASTTVVYRHVKVPLGAGLSKYGSKLRALMTSNRTSSDTRETDNTSVFQLQSRDGY